MPAPLPRAGSAPAAQAAPRGLCWGCSVVPLLTGIGARHLGAGHSLGKDRSLLSCVFFNSHHSVHSQFQRLNRHSKQMEMAYLCALIAYYYNNMLCHLDYI